MCAGGHLVYELTPVPSLSIDITIIIAKFPVISFVWRTFVLMWNTFILVAQVRVQNNGNLALYQQMFTFLHSYLNSICLQKMLCLNPKHRITINNALEHVYLRGVEKEPLVLYPPSGIFLHILQRSRTLSDIVERQRYTLAKRLLK